MATASGKDIGPSEFRVEAARLAMKVGLFSTSDIEGGAPRATFRLFQALKESGTDVSLVVQRQRTQAAGVIPTQRMMGWETSRIRMILDRLPAVFIDPVKRPRVVPNWVPDALPQLAATKGFDVVNLHLVNCGFMRIESLARFRQPLIWTLHDMWVFTGGCAYSEGCERYQDSCGCCPLLGAKKENDLSRRVWDRKRQAWGNLDLTIVTPSQWMKTCAERSSLLGRYPIKCIPYGIDTELFQPEPQAEARRTLRLNVDAYLVLFGATAAESDPRKGFDLLAATLARLPREISGRPVVGVVFGNQRDVMIPGLDIPLISLGQLSDDKILRMVYSAADVFAAPSREDNLPNTVIESLACGTPVVAFNIGGMPDMIDSGRTGRLVAPFNTEEFAAAIVAELAADQPARRAACRASATRFFSQARQAAAYNQLYEQVGHRARTPANLSRAHP